MYIQTTVLFLLINQFYVHSKNSSVYILIHQLSRYLRPSISVCSFTRKFFDIHSIDNSVYILPLVLLISSHQSRGHSTINYLDIQLPKLYIQQQFFSSINCANNPLKSMHSSVDIHPSIHLSIHAKNFIELKLGLQHRCRLLIFDYPSHCIPSLYRQSL